MTYSGFVNRDGIVLIMFVIEFIIMSIDIFKNDSLVQMSSRELLESRFRRPILRIILSFFEPVEALMLADVDVFDPSMHLEVFRDKDLIAGSVCMDAVYSGELAVLKWARSRENPWDEKTCASAAYIGQFDILKWAHENGCPWNEETCQLAAHSSRLDILKWAHENGCPWDVYTFSNAAESGSFEMLEYLLEQKCPSDTMACQMAANLDVLKWLRERKFPWDEGTCAELARKGDLVALEWAYENGCPPFWACEYAARDGKLESIKWARFKGFPWNEDTCLEAASHGHLHVLKWARGNGCLWDKDACRKAALDAGHTSVVEWIDSLYPGSILGPNG